MDRGEENHPGGIITNQLNAEYYRRRNWDYASTSTSSAPSAPAVGGVVVVGGGSGANATTAEDAIASPAPPTNVRNVVVVSAASVEGGGEGREGRRGGGGGGGRNDGGGASSYHRRFMSGGGRFGRAIVGSIRYVGYALGLYVASNVAYSAHQARLVDDFFGRNDDDRYRGGGDEEEDDAASGSSTTTSSRGSTRRGGGVDRRRRRVLTVPFDRIRVVERRIERGDIGTIFANAFRRRRLSWSHDEDGTTGISTYECREIVRAMHDAARDDAVVALHADFGGGDGNGGGRIGRAHATEIRDAMRVFNESHRVHREPNVVGVGRVDASTGTMMPSSSVAASTTTMVGRNAKWSNDDDDGRRWRRRERKYSHAYSQSYDWPTYFLASGCSHVHMQARGYLNLHGSVTSHVFVRGLLDKYGIGAHVFRHGEYKNAPSVLTDTKYSNAHLENVKSLTSSVDGVMRSSIEASRSRRRTMNPNFDDVMWSSIFDYGGLTSSNAIEIGLVDTSPPVDPISYLLDVNVAREDGTTTRGGGWGLIASLAAWSDADDARARKEKSFDSDDDVRKKFETNFGIHDCYRKFNATESVSLAKYLDMLNRRDEVERTREKMKDVLRWLSGTSFATSMILSALGLRPDDDASTLPTQSCDRIAVLTVDGNIDSGCASRVIRSLREIRKDVRVKAVVLRVDSPGGSVVSSEAMLEEIKLLDKPVICSMSNAAASGGYYISTYSKKIFASPMTHTGSIGVFGIKFDASEFANSFGVTGDHYPRGNHAAAMHPLAPLTPGTKRNIERMVLDYYDYFKAIVAAGRSLSVDDVEKVAMGRVWTGEQAREVGLVDALGGLDRAISFAKRAYATTERVEVDYFPRKSSLLQLFSGLGSSSSYADVCQASFAVLMGLENGDNERVSLEKLLREISGLKFAHRLHFMLTMDEETAMNIIMKGD